MKNILTLILFFYFISSIAQEQKPYYSEVNKILWERDKDTLLAITDNPPFNIADVDVILSPITSSCVIYFINNSDQAIEVNWSQVDIQSDGNSIMTNLRGAVLTNEQQQIQKVPKRGKVWQHFDAIYGDKVLNIGKAKRLYKKNKKPSPILLEAIFPVIYNDEEIKLHKICHGLYDPNYQEEK